MYHPDEFWQSTEVAYSDVYKIGERPWEWEPDFPLRTPLYAGIFRSYYEIIKYFLLDNPDAVVIIIII
jgi:hypothetical protein